WDGWPDGVLNLDFDWPAFEKTGHLMLHWSYRGNTLSNKKGKHSTSAARWQDGRVSERRCMGVIRCDNERCDILVRPQTRKLGIDSQLLQPCQCGATLQHQKCPIVSRLYTWRGGVHYVNGPQESVADISPVLVNQDRVRKERQRIKGSIRGGISGNNFVKDFAQLDQENAGFIVWSQIGHVTVIALQTEFMRSLLAREAVLNEPVNGLVSDAAHKFWKDRDSILIVTSTFSEELLRWVPVMFSYSNGQSAEHYKCHFLALFLSIAKQCADRSIVLTDKMLAQVMDYGEVQRAGFLEAYVLFWKMQREDERSESQLRADATCVLKGCQEHFRAGTTRIKRNGNIV
ncbi:hypothetical protein GLOTRDRAFT_24197, partial [Gloeophyllum trabeum ATCC 11539]